MSEKEPFPAEQKAAILASLQRYFDENYEIELNELQSSLLLDYIMTEIAPFAYNRGVEDAQAFFSARTADLPGVCFEDVLTYWESRGSARVVRRKP